MTTGHPGRAYERITNALQALNLRGQYRDGRATVQCPAHEDRNPSLSVTRTDNKTLIHCFSGCQTQDVLAALNLHTSDLFDYDRMQWDYTDPDTGEIYRTVSRNGDKQYRQQVNDLRPRLYNLQGIRKAKEQGEPVYLVEGEKDADTLTWLGHHATTAPMGAANFEKVDVTPLTGLDVIAIVDKDEAGAGWAQQVRESVDTIANSLTFKTARVGKDITDHAAAGHHTEDLQDYTPKAEQVNGHRKLNTRRASQIAMESTQWLWQDNDLYWMPLGEFTLLGGREGIGKSTMAYHIAAQITRGELTGDHYGTPKAVIICATEDSWSKTIIPRLKAVGADLDLIFQVNAVTPEGFPVNIKLPLDIQEMETIVAEENVALIILDPLMSAIDAKLDTHKDAEVRRALEPMTALAMRANAAVVGLIHQKKGQADDLRARLMASIAFVAVSRNVLYCGRRHIPGDDNPKPTYWLGQIKTNLGPKAMQSWTYSIETAPDVGWDANRSMPIHSSRIIMGELEDGNVEDLYIEAEREALKAKKNTTSNEAQHWLENYMGNQSLKRQDVLHEALDEMGYTEITVKRAFRALNGESSPIPGTKNEKYWRLPHVS